MENILHKFQLIMAWDFCITSLHYGRDVMAGITTLETQSNTLNGKGWKKS
jgi:hypothetical protein